MKNWENSIRQSLLFIFGAIEFFIGLRVVLKFLGANPGAPVVSWVYASSSNFLSFFEEMFSVWQIDRTKAIEFSSIFAMFFYAIMAYFILEALAVFFSWRQNIFEVLRRKPLVPQKEEKGQ